MAVSAQVLHVLQLVAAGRDPTWVPLVNGKGSQARTVGRGVTVSTAVRDGLLKRGEGWTYSLTPAGRAELDAYEARRLATQERAERKSLMRRAHWEKGYRCHGLWTNDLAGAQRLGRVSIGPAGLWDRKTYHWLLDNPKAPGGVPLAEGEADSLKAAKAAVEVAYLSLPFDAFSQPQG